MAARRSLQFKSALLTLAAAAFLSACGGHKGAVDAEAVDPKGAREVLRVELRETADLKPVSATLTNRDSGLARARVGGTLMELAVREGDQVTEGQVLAIIGDERRNLEASASRSAALAAEARASEARVTLKRVEELFAKGVYAKARLDSARAEARAADAQLKSARDISAALEEAVGQGKVLAPADGKVTRAPVPQGAVVMPGEVIAEIATGRRVLRAEIPESDGADLREGDEIAILASGAQAEAKAKILQVYPAVQAGKVVLDIDAASLEDAFVGMRIPVLIPIGVRQAIAVPDRFVTVRYGVDYATLHRDGMPPLDIPVQTGRRFAEAGEAFVEILSGLRPGDSILAPPGAAGESDASAIAASENFK